MSKTIKVHQRLQNYNFHESSKCFDSLIEFQKHFPLPERSSHSRVPIPAKRKQFKKEKQQEKEREKSNLVWGRRDITLVRTFSPLMLTRSTCICKFYTLVLWNHSSFFVERFAPLCRTDRNALKSKYIAKFYQECRPIAIDLRAAISYIQNANIYEKNN